MFKCSKCIFYDSDGYSDMGCTIPECKLRMLLQQRLKSRGEKYDLFKALIHNDSEAEQCSYFTYVCEIVDYVIDKSKVK